MPIHAAESILRAMTEPILVLDGSLKALLANPVFYRVLGIAPGQLEGRSVHDLIGEKNGQGHLRPLLEAIVNHDSNVEDLDVACTVPPGTHKIFSVSAQRLSFGENFSEVVLVELRDITHDREVEAQIRTLNDALLRHGNELEQINAELESFTHSVSHDLRTPLRMTNKIANLLLEEHREQLAADAVKKVHMILDSTHQMGKLIEDLLIFSRVKREPIKKRQIDLGRLTREVLAELAGGHKSRDVEIIIDPMPPCYGDRALLKQVMLNLLGNALKFTRPRERAEIRIGSTQQDGETVYLIRDNGIGFDMCHAESIFLPFQRLHKTQHFEGSGVGLALVRRIINRHGGRIWVEAQKDGGAAFYFTLGGEPIEKLSVTTRTLTI